MDQKKETSFKKYKIIYKPLNEKAIYFFTDSYEIVDNNASIKFFYDRHNEFKVFPYVLCQVKVLDNSGEDLS